MKISKRSHTSEQGAINVRLTGAEYVEAPQPDLAAVFEAVDSVVVGLAARLLPQAVQVLAAHFDLEHLDLQAAVGLSHPAVEREKGGQRAEGSVLNSCIQVSQTVLLVISVGPAGQLVTIRGMPTWMVDSSFSVAP